MRTGLRRLLALAAAATLVIGAAAAIDSGAAALSPPPLGLTYNPLDFGVTADSSVKVPLAEYVSNTGTSDITLGATTGLAAGSNFEPGFVNTCATGVVLHSGQSCLIQIMAHGSGPNTGTYGTLTITVAGYAPKQVTMVINQISGNAVLAASVNPSVIETRGSSTVTFTDVVRYPVYVTRPSLSSTGGNWAIAGGGTCGVSITLLHDGQSCTVVVSGDTGHAVCASWYATVLVNWYIISIVRVDGTANAHVGLHTYFPGC